MKRRFKFVSNSSSSSFIVKFPIEPKSVQEVKEIVFGDEEFIYSSWGDDKIETLQAATIIFNEIGSQKKNDLERARELAGQIHDKGAPKYEDFTIPGKPSQTDWNAYDKAIKEYGEKILSEFYSLKKVRQTKIKKLEGKDVSNDSDIFYIFSFSDDTTVGAILEHSNIFKRLKHIYINQH